jgi:uncharacterized protein YpiB (UPF0302 family)
MIHSIRRQDWQVTETVYTLEVSKQFVEDLIEVLNRDIIILDALDEAGEVESRQAFERLVHDRQLEHLKGLLRG